MKWTHCALETKKLHETLQFYLDFCQMNVIKDRVDKGRRVTWLISSDRSGPVLVLVESLECNSSDSVSESMLRHFGFELSSRLEVDLIYEKLIEAGINATKPVFVDKNTGYVCMTQDPEKRWVEFSYGQDVSPSNWG